MNKVLPTIAVVLTFAATAALVREAPPKVEDVVKQVEMVDDRSCGQDTNSSDYLRVFCHGQEYVVLASELKALGNTEAVEQKISELLGGKYEIHFDFTTGMFVGDKLTRHAQ